jgi:hypothetical protein
MSECECGGRGVLAVFYIVFLERAFGFAGLERVRTGRREREVAREVEVRQRVRGSRRRAAARTAHTRVLLVGAPRQKGESCNGFSCSL